MKFDNLLFPESVHLLVAAGNDSLRLALLDSLTPAGYRVEEVCGENEAVDVAGRRRFDLVLLGFSPLETSGIDACRQLRARAPHLGIVMVRDSERPEDEQTALDAGADDCITAPFRFREIMARLNAVLRRVPAKRGPKPQILRAGRLKLDLEAATLRLAGKEVNLSQREFDLLHFLMKNPERAFTNIKLVRALWGNEGGHGAESLRTHINGLRKKIENDPAQPQYILTEPWVGYRFHDPGRASSL